MKQFARWAAALVVLATASLPCSLSAGDPKPDFQIVSKSIEASVLLGAPIKADAALAADCLAEGRKWAEKYRAEADAARKEMPDAFRDGGWTVERKYDQRSLVAERYVSIVRSDYTNTGGAHPNSDLDTIVWDRSAGKRISIRPFFKDLADDGAALRAIRDAIIVSLKTEKLKRDIDEPADPEWTKAIAPKLLKIGAVTLAPSTEPGKSSGLTFHYPPYAVGPYAEGSYVAFVSWDKLKPYLSAEGAAIFGGTRPKGDEDL
ncbi:MAG: DUF3298 domain-containing protein [Rhodopseudomonas palustris]|nr:MAG: DUF3298 domain-containing protein [Rhodopseudomonas palustris]